MYHKGNGWGGARGEAKPLILSAGGAVPVDLD